LNGQAKVQEYAICMGTDGTSRKRAVFARENLARYARGEEIAARVG